MRLFAQYGRALSLTAALLAIGMVLLSGCGDDGNTGGSGGGCVSNCRDKNLVGAWLETYDDDSYDDIRHIISLESSGKAVEYNFKRIGSIWIEDTVVVDTWRTTRQYQGRTFSVPLILFEDSNGERVSWWFYRFSGNQFIALSCSGEDNNLDCHDGETHTKVNVSEVKNSLGVIYKTDDALNGVWALQNGLADESITFRGYKFEERRDNEHYYLDIKEVARGYPGYWYTDGNTLVLFAWNDYTITVALTYSVTGSGNNRTLKINDDIWRFVRDVR